MRLPGWRQIAAAAGLALLGPLTLRAQSTTHQIYGGFAYVRTDDQPAVNAYGWEVSYAEYPCVAFHWIGATLEASGVYAGPVVRADGKSVPGLLHNQIYTFMGGPSFQARSFFHHVRPSGHVLLGAVLTDVNTTGKGQNYFGAPVSESHTAFGIAIGGGLDYALNRNLSFRESADWLRSDFEDKNLDRQNSLRASAGLVVRF